MGFDDFLVNTYEENAVGGTQDTHTNQIRCSTIEGMDYEYGRGGFNRISMEDDDCSDTNLLEETSMFKHNLPSRSSLDVNGLTEETQFVKNPVNCLENISYSDFNG